MVTHPIDKESIKQIKSGFLKKKELIKEGWNTWEFPLLVLCLGLILYISYTFVAPIFISDSEFTPDKEEHDLYIDIDSQGKKIARLSITCSSSGQYPTVGGTYVCEYRLYNKEGNARVSEELLIDLEFISMQTGLFIEHIWVDEEGNMYNSSPLISQVPDRTDIQKRGNKYTVSGTYITSLPKTPGNYKMKVQVSSLYINKPDESFAVYERIYSEAKTADFRYRETVSPLEQLVAIGLLLAIFRLFMELSERIKTKVSGRQSANKSYTVNDSSHNKYN
ncbi:hypothetical protein [Haloarchaeobius sp. DT45]|uniref:hypothetical protein n=1 Tax=Haloarchaeobius sp. DT45 TaxID=3446116 RepID=UPI003F6BD16F